jgi:pimeloyl-ACP methyl ester carboxylesterase
VTFRRLAAWSAVVLTGLLAAAGTAHAAVTPFSASYAALGSGSSCTEQKPIEGNEPAGGGRHPVLVYLHATGGEIGGGDWKAITEQAAQRGFVAAAPTYASLSTGGSPARIDDHAHCIFGDASSASALSVVCSRPTADCGKGVVVAGHSQGGMIAGRAANHAAGVSAAFIMSVPGPAIASALAVPAGTRKLPNSRVRAVVGARDVTSGYASINAITGRSCTTNDCLAADGSGWYAVQDSEVEDGEADHCFFHVGGCYNSFKPADPGWLGPSKWGLRSALDFLERFTSGSGTGSGGDSSGSGQTGGGSGGTSGTGGGGGAGAAPSASGGRIRAARVIGRRVTVRHGRVKLHLVCPDQPASTGRVWVRTRAGRLLGSRTFTCAAGGGRRTITLRVKGSHGALRAAKLSVTVRMRVAGSGSRRSVRTVVAR